MASCLSVVDWEKKGTIRGPDYRMLSLFLLCKKKLLEIIACMVFYSGVLRVFNSLMNREQPPPSEEKTSALLSFLKRTKRNVQILTYHRVNDDGDPFFPGVPLQVFMKQMEYLASLFHILSLEEAAERMELCDVPENALVITFDDGYRDNYTQAFPILQKFSIPATIFLATDVINSRRVLWHDRVFSAFRETPCMRLVGYGLDAKEYPLGTGVEKLHAQAQVLRFLRSLSEEERLSWITCLEERLEVASKKERPDLMLSWDEVKVMHRAGIAFGSHTVTHPMLSTLSIERTREEIWESKQTLEGQLGIPVRTFAYPNGTKDDFSDMTKDLLKDAGYTCAVTTIFGVNESDQDRFELRRGGPWEFHLPTFAMKLHWYKFIAVS